MPATGSTDRILPHNIEAERSLLASMIQDNDSIGSVVASIKPRYFFAPENRHIYQAIIELFEKNRPADAVMVTDTLRRNGVLDAIGGVNTIATIVQSVSSGVNAEHYAQIVRGKALRRELIAAHTQALEDAYDASDEEDVIIDRSQHAIFRIAEEEDTTHTAPIGELLNATMRKIEDLHDRHDLLTGIRTGFTELDDLTTGLQPGELIILAARPSVGKTALARTITENVAISERKGVAFFSLEMSQQQIVLNMLCSRAKINAHEMRRGILRDDRWADLAGAADVLSDTKIFIDDTPGLSPLQLRAKARRLCFQGHVDLIVVDYLQLMSAPQAENRQQQIAEISRGLKALSRDLNVPIVALSQLNRAVDKENREPRLHDLRESGAIEQDADVVLLLHREDYLHPGGEEEGPPPLESVAKLIVAKQRNGPVGWLNLTFRKQFIKFENFSGMDVRALPAINDANQMTY